MTPIFVSRFEWFHNTLCVPNNSLHMSVWRIENVLSHVQFKLSLHDTCFQCLNVWCTSLPHLHPAKKGDCLLKECSFKPFLISHRFGQPRHIKVPIIDFFYKRRLFKIFAMAPGSSLKIIMGKVLILTQPCVK